MLCLLLLLARHPKQIYVFFFEFLVDLFQVRYILNGSPQDGRFVQLGLISGHNILELNDLIVD